VDPSDALLVEHDVLVPTDNAFQRQARLLQALWRERRGLRVGLHRGRRLGSRLEMPFAEVALANYMTDTIRDVVRSEVLDPRKSDGKVYRAPRIFDDLLSSQPLCFNLFGELQRDLGLASRTFAVLLGEQGLQVTAVEFEHSPGRGDLRFTGDGSAFDVFVDYDVPSVGRGFVGIEVKYAENLAVPPARHRPRYEEVADAMGVFLPAARERLRVPPLEQFWRDHLLAGSLADDATSAFERASFAVVYPRGNSIVGAAVEAYAACLRDRSTFQAWTLEDVLEAMGSADGGTWVDEVRERYLGERG
jgi:hypothetical protein